MAITNKITLEVTRVVLPVILVHAFIYAGFDFQWFLNFFKVEVLLVEVFDLFIHVKRYSIASFFDKLIDD